MARLTVLPWVVLLVVVAGCGSSATTVAAPSANAQLEFGVRMAQRGLWSEALFRFQQAERLDPANGRTVNNLAVAHEALGQFDEALDYYQKALQRDPGNRELKKNYARFIEFYQNYRPREGDESDDDGETDSSG